MTEVRAKPVTVTAFLPKRCASFGESRMTMMIVPVPSMLKMLLATSATLDVAAEARSAWTM